jgi:glycine/D-amino acid oxidase-like deaminating enzyme
MSKHDIELLLQAESAWYSRFNETETYTQEALPKNCDLLVVGAGLTGLTAALKAASVGWSVTILEKNRVGAGATGKNSGFVVPIPSRCSPTQLKQLLGSSTNSYLAALSEASSELLSFSECASIKNGWMQTFESYVNPVTRDLARNWHSYGVRVNLLDGPDVACALGSDMYHSALLFERGGHLDPLALARSLAGRCKKLGVKIVERCTVTSMPLHKNDEKIKTLETNLGNIEASHVLLAGNVYSDQGVASVGNYAVSFPLVLGQFELSEKQQLEILPKNVPLSDSRKDMWFFRKSPEGNLITGMFVVNNRSGYKQYEAFLRRRIQLAFEHEVGTLQHLWAGNVGLTSQGLPSIQSWGENVLSWTGCNGRGLALSYVMGQLLIKKLMSPNTVETLLPINKKLYGRALIRWIAQSTIANDRHKRNFLL